MDANIAAPAPARRLDRNRRQAAALALAAQLLCGCTTIQVAAPPAMPLPAAFSAAPPGPDQAPLAEPARWWRALNDPVLSGLIEDALAANHDVRLALASLREARANAGMAEALLAPSVEAGAAAVRSRQRSQLYTDAALPNGMPLPQGAGLASPFSTGSAAGFSAAWEVDLFGARGSDAEAARQAALSYQERLHGAQLLVAAELAGNYLEARGIAQRLQVLDDSIATLTRLQRYAAGRYRAGQASELDRDKIASKLAALAAQRHLLELTAATRLRRIAVLGGRRPDALSALPAPDAGAPDSLAQAPRLPTVLPSEVLELRPDVRGSANIVRAQAARLGSARADLLPKFYLGFLQQYGHLDISGTRGGMPLTALGAGLRVPVFEAGRLRAAIAAQDARLDGAAADYEKTVLAALEDVDNAYSARHALDQRCADLARASAAAAQAAQAAQLLFEHGHGLLQAALEARLDALEQQDALIQGRSARATSTVLLYKAIGAGWSPATPL